MGDKLVLLHYDSDRWSSKRGRCVAFGLTFPLLEEEALLCLAAPTTSRRRCHRGGGAAAAGGASHVTTEGFRDSAEFWAKAMEE